MSATREEPSDRQKERRAQLQGLKDNLSKLGRQYLNDYPEGGFRIISHNNQSIAKQFANSIGTLNEVTLHEYLYDVFNNNDIGSLLTDAYKTIINSNFYPQINALSDNIKKDKHKMLMNDPDDRRAIEWDKNDYMRVLKGGMKSREMSTYRSCGATASGALMFATSNMRSEKLSQQAKQASQAKA